MSCPPASRIDITASPGPATGFDRQALPNVLSLNAHGHLLDWISWREALHLHARGAVLWTLGKPCLTLHGGHNPVSGLQSRLELYPIMAIRKPAHVGRVAASPSLNNAALFARDGYLCLYCGHAFSRYQLTRDHVLPRAQGGQDVWENVVSACLSCNIRKGARTPAQAGMPLLAVPYRPSWVEHLLLCNRNILADQMQFLQRLLPKRPTRCLTSVTFR